MKIPGFWSTEGNQMWADLFFNHSQFNQDSSANFKWNLIIWSKGYVFGLSLRYTILTVDIFLVEVKS